MTRKVFRAIALLGTAFISLATSPAHFVGEPVIIYNFDLLTRNRSVHSISVVDPVFLSSQQIDLSFQALGDAADTTQDGSTSDSGSGKPSFGRTRRSTHVVVALASVAPPTTAGLKRAESEFFSPGEDVPGLGRILESREIGFENGDFTVGPFAVPVWRVPSFLVLVRRSGAPVVLQGVLRRRSCGENEACGDLFIGDLSTTLQ